MCFLELGLSADTDMADRISELHRLTFLSNSDAHSPWPNRMGREFNQLRLKDISFVEVEKSLKGENGRGAVLNVGLNPLEGKYHKTRCSGCLAFFRPQDAVRFGWRCPGCGKPIKKGVDFRIEELADLPAGEHPEKRPKYVHIIPLSEIIALATGTKNVYSGKVQSVWNDFISRFGSETRVLLDEDIPDLAKIDGGVAEYIRYFRENRINYIPGGAGVYGKLLPPGKRYEMRYYEFRQKGLGDFLRRK